MLALAEQIRAQKLTDEQVEQLVRQTRSCTKAARTQAAPLSTSIQQQQKQQQQQQQQQQQ